MAKGEDKKLKVGLVPSDFVHLHNHTNYSLLDGLTKMPELCQMVKDSGMEAVAVTDHGTVSGWLDLYKTAEEYGVKPIFGLETYVANRKHTDRDPAKDKERYHLTLLAMNNKGYENIMRLSSIANLEGMYYKPRVDRELLEKYQEGIICMSGCQGGEVSITLSDGNYDQAKEVAQWYKNLFGDRYYLEVQDFGHPDAPKYWADQNKINDGLLKIAKELDIPAVVTCDAHYLRADDVTAHEILLCVGTGSFLSEPATERMSLEMFDLHVMEPEKIIERWGNDYPELIKNTKRIADRCEVTLDLGGILIPKFPCPKGFNEKTYLHKLTWNGLAHRYGVAPKEADTDEQTARKLLPKNIVERADYELGVVEAENFNGYFLIVQDFINWGKSQGIVFGPGRGSAAGSIISYGLKITDLDPLKYDLLFERFLNPDRISMPDIDIDIQDTRRDEVINYCTEKYGAERVANICTFGKMMARNAVRDVARVLEVPYSEADRLSKLIPSLVQGRHAPLKDSVEKDPDLRHEYETNATSRRVIDFAMQLEGTIRSHGVHAAGVVIAPDELVKYTPLEMSQKGVVATQFPMGPIEELGLLKMDFLGLSNLTIINNALRIVRKVYKKEIDLSELPMDDKKTYELFQRGDTTGVFQLESAGMKRYLKQLKPTTFDDIIAMVALYRPGPMSEIPKFIARKHGREAITYYEDKMKSALENTYGILVYQEQFMQISKEVCGFTGGEADTLRKAVGKKKMDLMKQMKSKLIEGGIKNGADKDKMEAFWDHLEEFANYCFNKSHAACYATIAYWTAYIKAHYPSAFMAALMTSDRDDTDRLAIEIAECKHMGIKVLLPDINESFMEFAIVPETGDIRFGLAAVKGVGGAVVEEIERVRKIEKFSSIEDYAKRVNSRLSNRKVWENLIKSGAFDKFVDDKGFPDRSDLLFNIEQITEFSRKIQSEVASGQGSLFEMDGIEDIAALKLMPAPQKYSEKEQLAWERELLGLYLSAHPLDKYDTYFIEQTNPINTITSDMDGSAVVVGGLLATVRSVVTKSSGNKMAFMTLEDKTGQIEVVVFARVFEEFGERLKPDVVVKIEGRISGRGRDGNRSEDPSIVANTITFVTDDELDNYQPTGNKMADPKVNIGGESKSWNWKSADEPNDQSTNKQTKKQMNFDYSPVQDLNKTLYIHIKDPNDSEKLVAMKKKLGEYNGENKIVLVLGDDKKDAMKLPFTTSINDELIIELKKLIGEERVIVK